MITISDTNTTINIKNKNILNLILLFMSIAFITYMLNINNTKSSLNYSYSFNKINNLINFKEILIKNTLCFIWILSGILLGKIMVLTYIVGNGIILGLLISKFKSIKYLFLILPHGISEIFSFLLTCNIVLSILKYNSLNLRHIKQFLLAYIIILISALIEAFITPIFINFV